MERMGGRRRKNNLIAIDYPNGTGIIDDSGNFWAFIPDRHYIVMAKDRYFVAIHWAFDDPYVRVYNLYGDFLVEGRMSEALKKARQKDEIAMRLV
jgi:hypothetical protein